MFSLGSNVSQDPIPEDAIYRQIKTIIKYYIDLARRQPIQNVGIPAHFLKGVLDPDRLELNRYAKVPVLTISGFVNLANVSLQSNTNFTLPYIESIYRMAGVTESCNGVIVIKYTAINGKQTNPKEYKYEESDLHIKKQFKPYFYFNRKDTGEKIYIPIDTEGNKNMYVLNSKSTGKRKTHDTAYYQNYLTTTFIDKFVSQYNDPDCKFISIAVNLLPTQGGHANMLLVYKGQTKIYLMLYEPHGAQGLQSSSEGPKEQYNIMKTHFINFMKNLIETTGKTKKIVELVDPKKISPKEGIQTYMKDRNGYCYMISSFWLYIILSLTKDSTQQFNDTLFQNLNIIERYLYSIAAKEIKKDQDELKNPRRVEPPVAAVTEEAASSSQRVLTVAKQGSLASYTPDQVLYSIIVHFSYDFLTKFYMNYFKPASPSASPSASPPDLYSIFIEIYKQKYSSMRDKKPKKFEKLVLGYIEDTSTNLSEKHRIGLESKAVEISKRVTDGLSCTKAEDCLSDKCDTRDKICLPRDYTLEQSQHTQSQQSSQESIQDDRSQSDHLQLAQIKQYPDVNDPPNIYEFYEKDEDYQEKDEDEDYQEKDDEVYDSTSYPVEDQDKSNKKHRAHTDSHDMSH
jgi:hypothetical protein